MNDLKIDYSEFCKTYPSGYVDSVYEFKGYLDHVLKSYFDSKDVHIKTYLTTMFEPPMGKAFYIYSKKMNPLFLGHSAMISICTLHKTTNDESCVITQEIVNEINTSFEKIKKDVMNYMLERR